MKLQTVLNAARKSHNWTIRRDTSIGNWSWCNLYIAFHTGEILFIDYMNKKFDFDVRIDLCDIEADDWIVLKESGINPDVKKKEGK